MKNQRKDGRFQKWVTVGKKEDGKPLRKIVYADTAEELEQKAAELKRNAALGKVGTNVPAFSAIADEWLREIAQTRSKSTVNGYRSYLNRFLLPAVGDKPIAEVTEADISKVLEKAKKENYSRSSAMQIKSIAERIREHAKNNGVRMDSEWSGISVKKAQRRDEQRTLTENEIALIVTKTEGHPMCLPALIMLFCGLKGTEIRALRWEDICIKKKIIRVNKALINCKFSPEAAQQQERIIPIPEQFLKYLKRHLPGEGLICPNVKGKPMTNGELQTAWTSYCRFLYRKYDRHTAKEREHISGQDFFTTQTLRMTCAKMLFESELNILEIQYLLGHTSLEATFKLAERFLEVDTERMREKIKSGFIHYID